MYKRQLYEKPDFSDEDGIRASELETEFAELNGWEAESDASKLIQGLGLPESLLYAQMEGLTGKEKVKVLLAQCLFGNPDIILMDLSLIHICPVLRAVVSYRTWPERMSMGMESRLSLIHI